VGMAPLAVGSQWNVKEIHIIPFNLS